MKRLPIVIMMVVAGSFLAFKTMGTGTRTTSINPPSKYEQILKLVGEMLSQAHYSPQDINDDFSKKVFKKFITDLDPDKNMYLQSDMEALKAFETKIDNEIKGSPVEFFLAAGKIFNKRMEESAVMYREILAKPFDFTTDEEVNLDADKLNYTTTNAESKDRWRKKLKFMTLERYVDLVDIREKNKGKDGFVVKTDSELEKDARDRVKKIMDRTFDRFRFKFNDDDKFNLFVNAITTTMDPHTEFFPPVDKRYFDEEMSGVFYGIGASLQYDDGNIKVSSVLSGSPAFKSGEIQQGDIILKVAQGKEEPVDLTGFVVTDAVKVIRGKQGTEVRLTIKKADGTIKIVTLIRDKIVQDETYARSAIVKEGSSKIGYIFLPEFYADFDRPNGPRSFVDVAKEVAKLKEEKVDGIVIDLRNNGGGSLYDVVQMAGLFIDEGPIVQVKDRENKPSVLKDKDKNVLYTGPLAVMVNEFSASASEIFAAAIQDYNRGVIIGSTSTYGKGTVQRNIGLDETGLSLSNSDLGTVKLTLQKFYRINGGSTQLKGVYSDIVLPDNLEHLKVREKDNEDALPWDEITKATYNNWNSGYDLKTIQQLAYQRLDNDPSFKLIKESSEWLSKQNDKQYSLQIDKYRNDQKTVRTTIKQLETLLKLKDSLNVSPLSGEENRYDNDKSKKDRFAQWIKGLQEDIYLDQAIKVMNDMIGQQNLAKAKGTEEPLKKGF
ncbi:MAG: carboxy terminal-processing peptidase [Chitinophagaceae bacterium]|nr:carboxy terminal-processing peptidase [Chitinophagaceae bacterium]MBK7679413.1 carboxy terminal-processing peptidase [Chitinophagaceae bacterium]MBK9659581.1 carboxy terminal-processing peptidase [Chitinophagaceae bacterium]MBP6233466.1 carboxy terminal-processing peptidase [Chitinophagaceae bacterium]MBP6416873.1 carboxy terminal-processing peptidase [Chitinophagaceae bacterium]